MFEWTLAKQAVKAGFPMALQQFIVFVGFVFIQRAVNNYGEAMTVSFTVAQNVETYTLAVRVISTYILQEIPSISYHMIW